MRLPALAATSMLVCSGLAHATPTPDLTHLKCAYTHYEDLPDVKLDLSGPSGHELKGFTMIDYRLGAPGGPFETPADKLQSYVAGQIPYGSFAGYDSKSKITIVVTVDHAGTAPSFDGTMTIIWPDGDMVTGPSSCSPLTR